MVGVVEMLRGLVVVVVMLLRGLRMRCVAPSCVRRALRLRRSCVIEAHRQ